MERIQEFAEISKKQEKKTSKNIEDEITNALENDMQLSLDYSEDNSNDLSSAFSEDDKDRVNFLKDEINKSNYKYYVEENPYLTDF